MAEHDTSPVDNSRTSFLKWIDSPLGIFVLALLICETFLSVVLTISKLSECHQFWGMWVGAAMFVLLSGAVWYIVWDRPQNLVFDRHSHLSMRKSNSELADQIISTEYAAYMGQKNWPMAEFACTKALELAPSHERAMISLALAKSHKDTIEAFKESLEIFGKVISSNKRSAKAFFNRGCIRAALSALTDESEGKKQLISKAVEDVRKATKLASYYLNKEMLANDADLQKIRDSAEFKLLISEI